MPDRGRCVAIVGAESTGKTQLAEQLASALREGTGQRVACVPEFLRHWCDQERRTPRIDEQADILEQQHRHIEAAAAQHDWVVCDTTALTTAVYSRLLFGDATLEARAGELHRRGMALTLLTALDLPWVADGLQRDGAHVREPVDNALRQLMQLQGIAYAEVGGAGDQRLHNAWLAVAPLAQRGNNMPRSSGLLTGLAPGHSKSPPWSCDCCTAEGEQTPVPRPSDGG